MTVEKIMTQGPFNNVGKVRQADGSDALQFHATNLSLANLDGLVTKDGGPSQELTRTCTESADGSGGVAITNAPASGKKIVAMDILISVDTACYVTIQMETSNNVLVGRYLPANGSDTITPRGFIKGDVADKKLYVKTSVASKVTVTCIYYSEA